MQFYLESFINAANAISSGFWTVEPTQNI